MKTMRRLSALVLLAVLATFAAPAPAAAAEIVTLAASGARIAAGQGSAVDIGNWREITVLVNVTAGSGTVNPFRVWLEGSPDGTKWYELTCFQWVKTGAAAPGASAAQRDIVSEVAVVTSGKWSANCQTHLSLVRAAWNISGSTPSETFSVSASLK